MGHESFMCLKIDEYYIQCCTSNNWHLGPLKNKIHQMKKELLDLYDRPN